MVGVVVCFSQHGRRLRCHGCLDIGMRLCLYGWATRLSRRCTSGSRAASSGMQSLVEYFQCKSPPPFGFGPHATGCSSLVEVVSMGRRYVGLRERCAYSRSYEHSKNLVCQRCDEWLSGGGEEFREGKGFACVASHRRRLRRVEVGEDGFVKTQVCPAREKSKNGQW